MVGGCHFQTFWVGSKPVGSIFLHIFGVRKKKKKNISRKNRFFSEKNRFLSVKIGFFRRKIGFYRKKSVFIGKIGDFSPIFFFPIFPLQNLFQARRFPIFLRKIGQFRRNFVPCLKQTSKNNETNRNMLS